MKEKMELKNSPAQVFAENLRDFLKLLEEMESKKENVRTASGELEGPFNSKAAYGYTVRLGIGENDFPFRRGFHPRPRPLTHVRSTKRKKGEINDRCKRRI